MPIKILKWYGRLGNNIQQCAVGILLAKQKNDTFQNIHHDVIGPIDLDFRKDKKDKKKAIYLNNFFYWNGYLRSPNIATYKVYKDIQKICQEYILPKLDIPKILVPKETLVIHIRSGDIFEEGTSFSNYLPNPYGFYQELIKLYNKVLIITEKDKKNPVLDKLKDNPKVSIQAKSVQEDFSVLLSAQNLATSGTSTFPIAAALCSKNLKNLYCSENFEKTAINFKMISDPQINIYECKLNNYINKNSWKNNLEQRKLIIESKVLIDFKKLYKNNLKLFFECLLVDLNLIFIKLFILFDLLNEKFRRFKKFF